jgi:hypothetical protein
MFDQKGRAKWDHWEGKKGVQHWRLVQGVVGYCAHTRRQGTSFERLLKASMIMLMCPCRVPLWVLWP